MYKNQKMNLLNSQIKLFLQDNQQKENLLYIHGYGSKAIEAPLWDVPQISAHYNVYACNFPGITGTEDKLEQMNLYYFRDLVIALINKLQLDNLTIVGHSVGGAIAALVNQKMANKVQQTILIAPMSKSSNASSEPTKDNNEPLYAKDFASFKKLLDFVSYQGHKLYDTPEKEAFLKSIYQENYQLFYDNIFYDTFGRNLNNPQYFIDIEEGIKLTKSLALINGDSDGINDYQKVNAYFQKVNPQTSVYVIPQSGHNPWMENKGDFLKTLEEILHLS